MSYPAYSALLNVCKTDTPQWLSIALDSILNQTIKPSEIVLVQNGPLSDDLKAKINLYKEEYPLLFMIKLLPYHMGLGSVILQGATECTNGFIAYIDADGYSAPTRIEEEFNVLLANRAGFVGTNINEFADSIDNVTNYRTYPEMSEEIFKFAKRKIPMALSSALFKKKKLIDSCNFEDCRIAEDYALIINLLSFCVKGYNIQKPLVYKRHRKDNSKPLDGKEYVEAMRDFNMKFFKKGWFRRRDYLFRSTVNEVAFIMPRFVKNIVYNKVL